MRMREKAGRVRNVYVYECMSRLYAVYSVYYLWCVHMLSCFCTSYSCSEKMS